jgi:Vanin C-terminal domain
MAMFNGVRSFDGVADGGIRTCAIYACTDQIDVATCGRRFNASNNVVNSVRFDSIKISTVAPVRPNLLLMPNSVDISILPLALHQFTYEQGPEYIMNG